MLTAEHGPGRGSGGGRFEAVIFALDGLLIDSERIWHEVRSELADEVGHRWAAADSRACMGVDSATWTAYMIERLGLAVSRSEIERLVIGRMLQAYGEGVPWLPGAAQAVRLAAELSPVGLASGSPRVLIERVLCGSSLETLLSVIVCSDDVARGKPAPDIYLEAARLLGATPANSACVEDSAKGILAGRAAGMFVIAVPATEHPIPLSILADADLVIPSLNALTEKVFRDQS